MTTIVSEAITVSEGAITAYWGSLLQLHQRIVTPKNAIPATFSFLMCLTQKATDKFPPII